MECWTDGSCKPNPGPGGGAALFPKNTNLNILRPINHLTTINYAELAAIESGVTQFLHHIINTPKNERYITQFTLYTDSKFCWQLFQIDGYPNLQYYYTIMNRINKIVSDIISLNIDFNIVKVPAHTDILHNDTVDIMAKTAADTAVEWHSFEDIEWSDLAIPAVVQISQFNEYKNIIDKKNELTYLKTKRKEKIDRFIFEESTSFNNEQLFIEGQFDRMDSNKWVNNKKFFKEELEYLDHNSIEILNKLLSEHCNLNNYNSYYFKETNGLCKYCNVCENVSHFLIDCEKYDKQRHQFWKDLCEIDYNYNNLINFNTLNILFPQRIIPYPNQQDPNYRELQKKQRNKRFKIIRKLIKFVQTTERFNGEYGI